MSQPPPRGVVVGVFEVVHTHRSSDSSISATLVSEDNGTAFLRLPLEAQDYISKGKKVTLSVTEYTE